MCLRQRFKVRLKALAALTKDKCTSSVYLIMGKIYFGWLAVWVLSPDCRCRKMDLCDYCQAHWWSRRAWGRGVCAVPQICVMYPGICPTTEEKSRKIPQSGHPKFSRLISAEHCSFSGRGHYLALASTDLLTPATLGFHVRQRGQPSISVGICRVSKLGSSPLQSNSSQSSQLGLWFGRRMVEHTDSREYACY